MSDVLRLSCSIENEIGRNAMKNFASLLEKVFNEYHNIVGAYLKLLNQSEDKNVETSFSLVKSQLQDVKDNIFSLPEKLHEADNEAAKQVSLNAAKVFAFTVERDTRTRESDSKVDDTFLNRSETAENEIEPDKLLTSPVLGKKCSKLKKNIVIPSRIILESTPESNPPSSERRNALCSKNNSPEESTKVTIKTQNRDSLFVQNYDNNDEIACTPVTKIPKRLGVSTLYNVNTTLLSNGKKLKQSRLMFLPTEQDTSVTYPERSRSPLKPHESPVPKNNIKRNLEDVDDKQIDMEIIESSPKRSKSYSRTKSQMKLKRDNSKRSIDQISDRENSRSCTEFSNTKLRIPLIEMEKFSPNQQSPLMYTPTLETKHYLIKEAGAFYSNLGCDTPKSGCDILAPSQSPVFDINHLSFEMMSQNHEIAKDNTETQKRQFAKSIDASTTYNDDTFFALEEKNKGQNTESMKNSKYENCMLGDEVLQKSPPSKRSLMCSFDMIPERKPVHSKSKAERAKMNGISCWECKQYYEKLGLSEEEMKARQNQCSRHRTRYRERESTPEGFWDPVFPDTVSSTFEDD